MNEDLKTQRILMTIVQIIIVPLCNLRPWARFTPGGYEIRENWQKLNFREAARSLTGNNVFPVILVVCAALAIIISWTAFYYAAFVPAAVQFIIAVITYVYFMVQKNRGEGFPDLVGIAHCAIIFAGLMVALLMFKGFRDGKKKAAKS